MWIGSEQELLDFIYTKSVEKIVIDYRPGPLPKFNRAIYVKNFNATWCRFTTLPSLRFFVYLQLLSITGNQLKTLPPLDALIYLEDLFINNNKLTTLPKLDGLLNLHVRNNKLTALPEKIQTIFTKYTNGNIYPKWLDYTRLVNYL